MEPDSIVIDSDDSDATDIIPAEWVARWAAKLQAQSRPTHTGDPIVTVRTDVCALAESPTPVCVTSNASTGCDDTEKTTSGEWTRGAFNAKSVLQNVSPRSPTGDVDRQRTRLKNAVSPTSGRLNGGLVNSENAAEVKDHGHSPKLSNERLSSPGKTDLHCGSSPNALIGEANQALSPANASIESTCENTTRSLSREPHSRPIRNEMQTDLSTSSTKDGLRSHSNLLDMAVVNNVQYAEDNKTVKLVNSNCEQASEMHKDSTLGPQERLSPFTKAGEHFNGHRTDRHCFLEIHSSEDKSQVKDTVKAMSDGLPSGDRRLRSVVSACVTPPGGGYSPAKDLEPVSDDELTSSSSGELSSSSSGELSSSESSDTASETDSSEHVRQVTRWRGRAHPQRTYNTLTVTIRSRHQYPRTMHSDLTQERLHIHNESSSHDLRRRLSDTRHQDSETMHSDLKQDRLHIRNESSSHDLRRHLSDTRHQDSETKLSDLTQERLHIRNESDLRRHLSDTRHQDSETKLSDLTQERLHIRNESDLRRHLSDTRHQDSETKLSDLKQYRLHIRNESDLRRHLSDTRHQDSKTKLSDLKQDRLHIRNESDLRRHLSDTRHQDTKTMHSDLKQDRLHIRNESSSHDLRRHLSDTRHQDSKTKLSDLKQDRLHIRNESASHDLRRHLSDISSNCKPNLSKSLNLSSNCMSHVSSLNRGSSDKSTPIIPKSERHQKVIKLEPISNDGAAISDDKVSVSRARISGRRTCVLQTETTAAPPVYVSGGATSDPKTSARRRQRQHSEDYSPTERSQVQRQEDDPPPKKIPRKRYRERIHGKMNQHKCQEEDLPPKKKPPKRQEDIPLLERKPLKRQEDEPLLKPLHEKRQKDNLPPKRNNLKCQEIVSLPKQNHWKRRKNTPPLEGGHWKRQEDVPPLNMNHRKRQEDDPPPKRNPPKHSEDDPPPKWNHHNFQEDSSPPTKNHCERQEDVPPLKKIDLKHQEDDPLQEKSHRKRHRKRPMKIKHQKHQEDVPLQKKQSRKNRQKRLRRKRKRQKLQEEKRSRLDVEIFEKQQQSITGDDPCHAASTTSMHSEAIMSTLSICDPGAAMWFARQLPKLHLLLGDSVARDSGLATRLQGDAFLNLSKGGASWRSLSGSWRKHLRDWDKEVAEQGRRRGTIIIWMSGNDVYNRASGLGSFSEDILMAAADSADQVTSYLLDEAEKVVVLGPPSGLGSFSEDMLMAAADSAAQVTSYLLDEAEKVVVLGPLPRLSGEVVGSRWERSAAFHLERRLTHQLPRNVLIIPLGRQLTKKVNNRHSCAPGCWEWYAADGVHLTSAGYAKLEDSMGFPIWLRMEAGRVGW